LSGLVISKGGENGSTSIMHLDNEEEQNRTSITKVSSKLNDKDLVKKQKTEKTLNGSHVCKFCEIAFMDSIMYTIHMGYHGFQNPFKCNMCGHETADKVSFFMHVATKSHNQ
jgi:hunchback-like protein